MPSRGSGTYSVTANTFELRYGNGTVVHFLFTITPEVRWSPKPERIKINRAVGYAHIALSVGSRADVEALTERMRLDGVRVVSPPRQTGDGYFESVVEDPEGNAIEIAAD